MSSRFFGSSKNSRMLAAMRGPTSSTCLQFGQAFFGIRLCGSLNQRIHRSEVLRQKFRGALAHEAHAEPEQHALQRQFFRSLDFIENVLRRLVAHALQREQVRLLRR